MIQVKFPKLTKNVDDFPNLMRPRPCTRKDSDSPVNSFEVKKKYVCFQWLDPPFFMGPKILTLNVVSLWQNNQILEKDGHFFPYFGP